MPEITWNYLEHIVETISNAYKILIFKYLDDLLHTHILNRGNLVLKPTDCHAEGSSFDPTRRTNDFSQWCVSYNWSSLELVRMSVPSNNLTTILILEKVSPLGWILNTWQKIWFLGINKNYIVFIDYNQILIPNNDYYIIFIVISSKQRAYIHITIITIYANWTHKDMKP